MNSPVTCGPTVWRLLSVCQAPLWMAACAAASIATSGRGMWAVVQGETEFERPPPAPVPAERAAGEGRDGVVLGWEGAQDEPKERGTVGGSANDTLRPGEDGLDSEG